jgi:hypothetical protein
LSGADVCDRRPCAFGGDIGDCSRVIRSSVHPKTV